MELSWSMKLRIAAVAAVGIVLVGYIGRPSDMSSEQVGIAIGDVKVLIVLAFLSGAIGYFVSWPYGRHVGILAAPFGLSIWALRAGSMTYLMQLNPAVAQRQQLIASIRWEPIIWLAIVAAGFAGVLVVHKIIPGRKVEMKQEKHILSVNGFLNGIIAIVASVIIAQFCIRLLAQDVRMFDNRLGSMVTQPAVGQIVFAFDDSPLRSFATAVWPKHQNVHQILLSCPFLINACSAAGL